MNQIQEYLVSNVKRKSIDLSGLNSLIEAVRQNAQMSSSGNIAMKSISSIKPLINMKIIYNNNNSSENVS